MLEKHDLNKAAKKFPHSFLKEADNWSRMIFTYSRCHIPDRPTPATKPETTIAFSCECCTCSSTGLTVQEYLTDLQPAPRLALLMKICCISLIHRFDTFFSFTCRSSGTILFYVIHVLTSISNTTPCKWICKPAPLFLKQSTLQIHFG